MRYHSIVVLGLCALLPAPAGGQGLTGTLAGTVRDEHGGALPGATVRLSSPALIGGDQQIITTDKGQWRFPVLAPGDYVLTVELAPKFTPARIGGIAVGAGATIDRTVVLKLAGVSQSVTVTAPAGIDSRTSGLGIRFGPDYFAMIPSRRTPFDAIKNAPGISPTTPSSVTAHTVSAFGTSVDGNVFLIDGMNYTCPCQGVSRAEPSVDVIQEVHVQASGASVEVGGFQGAVFNIVTKQGGARYQGDASYYAQPAGLTAEPVQLIAAGGRSTGYERVRYRDFTTNVGGPILEDRLWFFGGYQYLRDYDSQPGADPAFPRKYEQDKIFGKLTWRLTPSLQLMQSFHEEFWVNPTVPTVTTPFITTQRPHASVPSMTFANLTHVLSSTTVWDARIGRFTLDQKSDPSSNDRTTPSHREQGTNVLSQNAPSIGTLRLDRITAKAVLNRYQAGWRGSDHHLKAGFEIERGEHEATQAFPGGVQFLDAAGGAPLQSISRAAWVVGGRFITSSLFASDSIALKDRITAEAGLRFDHARAISPDLGGVDATGLPTDGVTSGLGTLYTWNLLSPRLGLTVKLDRDARTLLRANFGRFHQGVLTGELDVIHPGVSTVTTMAYETATGGYTRTVSVVDPTVNLRLDPDTRAPRTDAFSMAVDRQLAQEVVLSAAYIRKRGSDFIGWTDTGGQYHAETRTLPDGTVVPVFALTNLPADRRFLLANPEALFLEYDGMVIAAEKRMSRGWQASGSYTFSRAHGLQVTSNSVASEPQFSTIARPAFLTFGQDPNDFTNAEGRLGNDRPHVFRTTGAVRLPWQDILLAANLQHFSGRPWAATGLVALPQTNNQPTQRILIEPRGSRRLSSQTLLDIRIGKTLSLRRAGTIDLRLDVLNLLNDDAEEGLRSDVITAATFGQPNVFIDPRRVMLSVRVNLGR
jgi:hemin uptake protein HemP